jgi:catechol 2,3-dioxygenase
MVMSPTESIDPATTIGAVHLTIADLSRSVSFYEQHLGFRVHRREARTVWLGAGGSNLLVLTQCETAPKLRHATGLYHFAILVPSRLDLAQSLRRLVQTDTVMQGFADHGVSEAIYLADPDGNGIEIYRDRARPEWPRQAGQLQMGVDALDLDSLLGELVEPDGGSTQLALQTTVGHIHLHVSRLSEAEAFYVGVLGFEMMQRYGNSALFVSAGGYHHHIGLNTWAGVGAPPPPPGAIGLRHFVLRMPNELALAGVIDRLRTAEIPIEDVDGGLLIRDPSQNAILFVADNR